MTDESLKKRWFKKNIIGTPQYQFYTDILSTNKYKIINDLQSGFIKLTKEDIKKIPVGNGHVDIYLLLMENGFAQYGDHPRLELKALRFYTILLTEFPHPEDNDAQRNKIVRLVMKIEDYLINASGLSLYRFMIFICKPMQKSDKLIRHMNAIILRSLDTDAAKELSWYSHDELDTIRQKWEEVLEREVLVEEYEGMKRYLVERWLPDIKELYHTEKAIQRLKMDHCKEEIMMNRWHPARVEKYLHMGIEIFDM